MGLGEISAAGDKVGGDTTGVCGVCLEGVAPVDGARDRSTLVITYKHNKLHSLAISSRDDKIMDDYKETKKSLQSALRNSEIAYFSNQLDIHINDMGKSWKVLRTILGKDQNKRKKQHSFFINNNYVTDSLQIANALVSFLCLLVLYLPKK